MSEGEPPLTAGGEGGGGGQGPVRRWLRGWAREAPNAADDGCWSSIPDGCDLLDGCDGCDVLDGCDGCDVFLLGLVHVFLALLRGGRRRPVALPVEMAADPALPWPSRWVLALLRGYRRHLSPRLPTLCRYTPSCSAYAAEAVRRHGARRGLVLAYRRIRRCNPSGGRGPDPVPEAPGR